MPYWKCKECGALCIDLVAAQVHALQERKPFNDIMEEVPPEEYK